MKNITEMGIESGVEAVIEAQRFSSREYNRQEFSCQKISNNEVFVTDNSPSVVAKSEHQKSLDFSAGAGLFIVVSLFFMFFMVPMAALTSVVLEIDLLPIAIAIMSSTMIAATFYLLLRVIDTSFK